MTTDDVIGELRLLIAHAAAVPPERLSPHARLLADLQLDSLEFYHLLAEIEERFGVVITEAQAQRLFTLAELESAVLRSLQRH